MRESNPQLKIGNLRYYHYTNPANPEEQPSGNRQDQPISLRTPEEIA